MHHDNSRRRYDEFRRQYHSGELDEHTRRRRDGRGDEAGSDRNGDGEGSGGSDSSGDDSSGSDSSGRKDPQKKRERKARRRTLLRQYVAWLKPFTKTVAVLMLLALFGAGLEMIHPLFLRYIIDQVLLIEQLSRAERLSRLHTVGMGFLAVIFAGQLLGLLRSYGQQQLNQSVMLSLRRALFDRMLKLPVQELHDMKTGGVISRLTGDVNTTTGLMQLALISPGVSIIRLLIAFGILFTLNWRLALTAMAIVPGVMLVSFSVARRIRPIYRDIREDASEIDSRVSETVGGIRVVRAFQRELNELATFLVGRHTIVRKQLFAHRRELLLWTSWGFLLALINLVIVWYGGYLQILSVATVGDIMAFQMYTFLLLNPVWQIVNSFSELQRSLAAMERVFEVLEMDEDKPDREDALEAPAAVDEIRFDNVQFGYREDTPVLCDFDVTVPGGSVVALVGRSGAGKTTVTDLVARFYDPTAGRILLNGVDLRQYRLKSYRELLGVVQQDVFLFDGTVRENIAYGRPHAALEEVQAAARKANAEEFILELADGYATKVGERGVKLSGGQCQRLSIARAILAAPQILIMDEATSNLDTASEQKIQRALADLLHGRTTFVVAHRLSTITHADLILVMEAGRIVERGTHQQLVGRGGVYAEMVRRQQEAV